MAVRLIGPASTAEMVLAFLAAEADGPRHRHAFVNLDRRLIKEPNLADPGENAKREAALMAYRGGYIGQLPSDTAWQRWELTLAELVDVSYANYRTWIELSGGTRRVADGAANVLNLLSVDELGVDVSAGIREASKAIEAGTEMPELLAVSERAEGSNLVLLEGHTRATAYVLAGKPPTVSVLVGWSSRMAEWPWF